MTDYPCLADTATIEQLVTSAGYEADVQVDPLNNGLSIRDAGLYSPGAICHSARIASSTPQNIPQGAGNETLNVTFNVGRWDTVARIIGASSLTTSAAGLWLFGACVGFVKPSAGFGNFVAAIVDVGGGGFGVIAQDGSYTGDTNYVPGVAETGIISLNPTGLLELPAGITFGVQATADWAGTAYAPPTTTNASSSPPTAVAARNEMAGAEFWCALVRPL